jgi:hypothetical protein
MECDGRLELHPRVRGVGDVQYCALTMRHGAGVEAGVRFLKASEGPTLTLDVLNIRSIRARSDRKSLHPHKEIP